MKRAADILARLGDDDGARLEWIVAAWESVVGAVAAARSRPASLNGEMLIVEAEGVEWADSLAAIDREIRARLNRALGRRAVRRIVFRPARAPLEPLVREVRSVPAEADGVRDPLRRKLYLAAKRRGRSGTEEETL